MNEDAVLDMLEYLVREHPTAGTETDADRMRHWRAMNRDRENARRRERRATDPEWRQRDNDQQRNYWRRRGRQLRGK